VASLICLEATTYSEAQLVREGADPVGGSAEQFGRFTQQEFEKWRTIVRESGATVD
jgi:hypothetical protein